MLKILKPLAVGVFVISGVLAIRQGLDTTDLSIIKSPDKTCQIKVTNGWARDPNLSNEGSIKVTNASDQMHVMVISHRKADLVGPLTLDMFTEASRNLKMLRLSSPVASPPIKVRINGKQGQQYLLKGDEGLTNVAYLITNLETVSHFHEIIAWTPSSLLGSNQALLQEVTETFRATN
jgi:hypothetical protein